MTTRRRKKHQVDQAPDLTIVLLPRTRNEIESGTLPHGGIVVAFVFGLLFCSACALFIACSDDDMCNFKKKYISDRKGYFGALNSFSFPTNDFMPPRKSGDLDLDRSKATVLLFGLYKKDYVSFWITFHTL